MSDALTPLPDSRSRDDRYAGQHGAAYGEQSAAEDIRRARREKRNYGADLDQANRDIIDLQNQVLSLQEVNQLLKRRNDRLQAAKDAKEDAFGHQESDDAICSRFKSLTHQIRTWSSRFCTSATKPLTVGHIDADEVERVLRISPFLQSVDDLPRFLGLGDTKRRRKFVRDWVALNVTETLFRTLPAPTHQHEAGVDLWIPGDVRENLENVERKLLHSGKPHLLYYSSITRVVIVCPNP